MQFSHHIHVRSTMQSYFLFKFKKYISLQGTFCLRNINFVHFLRSTTKKSIKVNQILSLSRFFCLCLLHFCIYIGRLMSSQESSNVTRSKVRSTGLRTTSSTRQDTIQTNMFKHTSKLSSKFKGHSPEEATDVSTQGAGADVVGQDLDVWMRCLELLDPIGNQRCLPASSLPYQSHNGLGSWEIFPVYH